MNKHTVTAERFEPDKTGEKTPSFERRVAEYCFAFMLGAGIYSLLEVSWRGFTHWTMTLTGGVCCCFLWMIANFGDNFRFLHLPLRCLLATLAITAAEFSVGCLVNLSLHWNVWDYSAVPGNLLGQICPRYAALWLLLSIPGILLCRGLKKWCFD